MKLLHTSDWHVGVLLGGRDRANEHAVFLEELEQIVREEKVEAILIAGDLFDRPTPSAESEKLVYDFFSKMAEQKVSIILIAGNHDSGARIEGKARLLQRIEIHAFGEPRLDAAIQIETRNEESLVVAALPFAGELRLLGWEEAGNKNPLEQKMLFAERMKAKLSELAKRHFNPNAVNILMAHLTIDGAALSGSERNLRMSESWTLPANMLPDDPHTLSRYIALGHIHKPQEILNAPFPAAYSGSPLPIDFGEEKDQKGVYLLNAKPGRPVELMFHPLQEVKPVKTIRTTLKEFEFQAKLNKNFDGHLKVMISLDESDKKSGIAEEIRKQLPQTSIVQIESPRAQNLQIPKSADLIRQPLDAYRLYLESQNRELTPDLSAKFQELLAEATHATP